MRKEKEPVFVTYDEMEVSAIYILHIFFTHGKKRFPDLELSSVHEIAPFLNMTQENSDSDIDNRFKGTVPRDFQLQVFCGDIRSSRCTAGVVDTSGR